MVEMSFAGHYVETRVDDFIREKSRILNSIPDEIKSRFLEVEFAPWGLSATTRSWPVLDGPGTVGVKMGMDGNLFIHVWNIYSPPTDSFSFSPRHGC